MKNEFKVIMACLGIFCCLIFDSHAATTTVTYNYDNQDRLTGVDFGNSSAITYVYDDAGNILTVSSQGNETLSTLSTTAVTGIGKSSASSGGNITSDGGASVTARGVCWSTSSNPTTSDNKSVDGSGTGSFTSAISGLSEGTTYYVRAYATNSAGTVYGNEVSFRILEDDPCVFNVLPTYEEFGVDGGNMQISVSTTSNCNWTAIEHLSWISVSPTNGTGDGEVTVNVEPNTEEFRNGIVTIAGVECQVSQLSDYIPNSSAILSDGNNDFTALEGFSSTVYGTQSENSVIVESGSSCRLINFPGNNVITIQSNMNLFTVSRSGAIVTFRGDDDTILIIPATTHSQLIHFDDGIFQMMIDNNLVMLGNQEIDLIPSPIISDLPVLTYYLDADGDGFGDPNEPYESDIELTGYVLNNTDNCPDTYNPEQTDSDGDGIGDACDSMGGNFVEIDLLSPNDGKLTLDTKTGIEWLDLTETQGLSMNQVVFEDYGGFYSSGFRHATYNEVIELFENAGITTPYYDSDNSTLIDSMHQLLGITETTDYPDGTKGRQSFGLFLPSSGSFDPFPHEGEQTYGGASLDMYIDGSNNLASSIIDDFVYFDANFLGTSVGHYLVRINGNEQNNPSLISPINGATGLDYNSVLTEWNYNNDSTSIAYIIFTLKEVDRFGSSNGTTVIFDENIGKTTSNALSNLSPNQWYKWWVELQFTDGSPPTADGGWFQTMMENNDSLDCVWNDSDPTANQLEDVIYQNGLFVAVGINGTILTSTDTVNWTSISSGLSNWFTSITYGLGKFIAVGELGTIISSSDGENWSIVPAGISGDLNAIIYSSGQFIAVGRYWDNTAGWYKGLIALSNDGINWTEYKMSEFGQLNGITYGDGLYLAVGYDNDPNTPLTPTIATSENALDWNLQHFIPSSGSLLENVSYGNGVFIIIGGLGNKVLLSQDGFSWEEITTGNMYGTWEGITYDNELFLIAGPNILSSPDGQNWTEVMSRADAKGVISYNEGIVAVGYGNGHRVMSFLCESDDTKITQYEDDLTEDFGGTKDENCFDVGSADRITVFGSLNPNEPYWDREDCFKFRVKQTGNYIFTFTIEMVDFYFYYYFGSLPYSTEVEIYGDLSTDEYDGIYFGDKGIQREIALTKDQYYFIDFICRSNSSDKYPYKFDILRGN